MERKVTPSYYKKNVIGLVIDGPRYVNNGPFSHTLIHELVIFLVYSLFYDAFINEKPIHILPH